METTIGTITKETSVWYVMHAFRKEEHTRDQLKKKNIECFVPFRYELKNTPEGRKTRKLCPAIPTYVFVRTNYNTIRELNTFSLPYLKNAVLRRKDGNKLIVVSDEQMRHFMEIARHYEEQITYYQPGEVRLNKGTKVRVHGGPFDGLEGVLVKVKGKRSKRIVVEIPGVTVVATSEIHPDYIEVLD